MVETQEEQGKTERPTANNQLLVLNLWKHMKDKNQQHHITENGHCHLEFQGQYKNYCAKGETAKLIGRQLRSPTSSKGHNQPSFLVSFGAATPL